MTSYDCDVLIIGSGIIGATYARLLHEKRSNTKIIMVDIGDQESQDPGAHKKNNPVYQKDIDQFVHIIKSNLSPVSIPLSDGQSYTNLSVEHRTVPRTGNPDQKAINNLPGQAVTRTVGGMGTHWTCSTPRFKGAELPKLVENATENKELWEGKTNPRQDGLYDIAEKLLHVSNNQFPATENSRQALLLGVLQNDGATPLRLACIRDQQTGYIDWSSAHTILEPLLADHNSFELRCNTCCSWLNYDSQKGVTGASLINTKDNRKSTVTARMYVLAAGAVATPQILFNSGIGGRNFPSLPNLGKYITEQPMAFCQTVIYKRYRKNIPVYDADPQVMIPFDDTEETIEGGKTRAKRPWHCQIHRDAFSYGKLPDFVKKQYIVDFRWFGRTKPIEANKLTFSSQYKDAFDMPQPTFDYRNSEADDNYDDGLDYGSEEYNEPHRMMEHMCAVASKIGRFLPAAGPQFMEPGLALHLGGTHRSGINKFDSVTDTYSKVWDISNLYLGGVGNIPTAFASNPTLTAMCYAIRSVDDVVTKLNAAY